MSIRYPTDRAVSGGWGCKALNTRDKKIESWGNAGSSSPRRNQAQCRDASVSDWLCLAVLQQLPYRHAPALDSRRYPKWRPHGEFRFRPDPGGALRRSGARLRPQTVPQQDRAFVDLRCRREAAARTDSGVLRLPRLAFLGPRLLAIGPAGAPVSAGAVRARNAPRRGAQSHA